MTTRLRKYMEIVDEHPELFENKGEGAIEIFTDPDRIQKEESKLKKELRETNLPESWADMGVLIDDPYFLVVRDLVKFPNGKMGGYMRFINREESLEGCQAVAILPVYDGKVVVLRNFRHATRNWELEIPRGFGEKGISAEENARKELLEETGLNANKLIQIGVLHTDTAARSSSVSIFYAEVTESNAPRLETNEAISDKIFLTSAEFEDMIKKRKITDGFTISAYSMAKIWRLL